jgi:TPP-dependent pyruvate/acetoin dehydrogenase alpha subunit
MVELLRPMLLIRAFEEALMRRPDHGFQLLSSGEEAVAVGLCAALRAEDRLLSSGRSIGVALARGVPAADVMAELLGKASGPCRGRGGRGHLAAIDAGFFGAHAVVGGNLTIATGVALALQSLQPGAIAAVVFGDGACGAGTLHESLNIAALWRLPLLFVCNNNGYSVSTPWTDAIAVAELRDLARPFGMPAVAVDGMDVVAVRDAASALIGEVRSGAGPAFLECRSERFASHSTSTRDTRSAAQIAAMRERCPIVRHAARLEREATLDGGAREALARDVAQEVDAALAAADAAPYPDAAEVECDVG